MGCERGQKRDERQRRDVVLGSYLEILAVQRELSARRARCLRLGGGVLIELLLHAPAFSSQLNTFSFLFHVTQFGKKKLIILNFLIGWVFTAQNN